MNELKTQARNTAKAYCWNSASRYDMPNSMSAMSAATTAASATYRIRDQRETCILRATE